MTISLKEEYKNRVVNIWNKYSKIPELNEPGFEYRKSPLLPESVKKNSILFIGINPSFTEKSSIHPDNIEIEFYPIIEDDKKGIPYFEKFKDISSYCNNEDWTHLDLFFLRETNQKVIENLSYSSINFLNEQLEITFEIIEKISPKIILVSNSLASEFFGKMKTKHNGKFDKIWRGFELDFEKDFNQEIGAYTIKLGNSEVPILFSGMLSGQRALDIGSFERLKWQMKRILDRR